MNCRLSIIIPVFNVEQYLRNCLESICNQESNSIEVILIDDGSSDLSGSICDEYASKYDYIKVTHTTNGGAAAARNIGLEIATGKYIAYVDPDDTVGKDWLRRLDSFIEQQERGLDGQDAFVFSYECVVVNGEQDEVHSFVVENGVFPVKKALWEIEAKGMFNVLWNKVYLRNLIDQEPKIRFIAHSEPGEDTLFNCDYFERCKNIVLSSEILYQYYRRGNVEASLSHKYYADLYEKTVQFTEKRQHLYDMLGMNSEAERKRIAKETEYYFFKCVPNMFRTLHPTGRNARWMTWKKMLNNTYLEMSIKESDNDEALLRMFKWLYGTRSIIVMDTVYSILFCIRNSVERYHDNKRNK